MSAIKIIISSALVTAALIKGVPAAAEPTAASDVNVSIVRTADLNLSTDAGKRQLDHRLVTAAYEVCGDASDVDLAGKNDVRQCRADVLAKARQNGEQLAARGLEIKVAAAR
jgi:UrcA family protein